MKKNWISEAIKNPGALRKTARAAGAITKKGTINSTWLEKKAEGTGKTAKRANLAQTLKGFKKGGK